MKKIDLITGVLGAGKTTFIKKYARHLAGQGQKLCLLANDYGAISVDRALLLEELGEICDIEMVTAGDIDCQRRRFRAKLISLGMQDYTRIIVEPSGVFDADDFYNILYDDPLPSWYEVSNVISIISADLPDHMKESEEYLLISQASTAGLIVLSRVQELPQPVDQEALIGRIHAHLSSSAAKYHCDRDLSRIPVLARDWDHLSEDDWKQIDQAGFTPAEILKMHFEEDGTFDNLFYFHVSRTKEEMRGIVSDLFADPSRYGHVIRVKGFFREKGTGAWIELNAVPEQTELLPYSAREEEQEEVIILVGEHMNRQAIGEAFGETRSVTDYRI